MKDLRAANVTYSCKEEMMSDIKSLLGPMRPPFLILAAACSILGLGTAVWTSGQINSLYFILAFVGAVLSHISVNVFNEYFDFKSGLDSKTQRTPFSGGSGTLQAKPELERQVLIVASAALGIAGLIGLYFLSVWGWALLPLGLLGLLLLVIYTPWLLRNPLLSLIAPGLGFGTFMVMGTDFVLTGEYTWTAFFASMVPFFLVSNLLLLNQFPDAEADQIVGRRHYPMVIGRQKSSLIYGVFMVLADLSLILGVILGYLPWTALIGLLVLILQIPTLTGAYKYADDMQSLMPYLGRNVLINILMPLLIALGLFIG